MSTHRNCPLACIRSAGDLEVVVLHESHGLLATIINPDLYLIVGEAPDQNVLFHTSVTFDLFLILLVEMFAEGSQSAYVGQQYQNWSLLKGLRWFCDTYQHEAASSGLASAVTNIEAWVDKEVPLRFWCSELDETIEFPLSNKELISFGANTAKHHLLRLSALVGKLEASCEKAGYNFPPQDYFAVLTAMIEEVRNRLLYHSSHIVELLGQVFYSLNGVIRARYGANPTNDVRNMTMPPGISSDVFKNMYGSVLVFLQYDDSRIRDHTPVTSQYFKTQY
ncbi:MAG: hypothetical protein ACYDBB_27200 [Armatimonadota bacterium]